VNDPRDPCRLILQAAPLAVLALDPGGRVLNWNAAAGRLFGWTEQEALGRVCPTVPEDGLDDFHTMLRQVLRDGAVNGLVCRRRKKDGSLLEASISAAPLVDGTGTTVGVVTVVEDVTERRQVQRELRQSEERFRSLCACSPVGIFLTDTEGRSTYANPAWLKIWGVPPEHGRAPDDWMERLHPDDRDVVVRGWTACAREGRDYAHSFRLRHPDGGVRWLRARAAPLFAEGRLLGHVGTCEDFTAQRQADELRSRCLERILAVQEDERRRLASQIHDGLCQSLTALLLRLHALETVPALAEARAQAGRLLEFTAAVAEEARLLVRSLRPAALDDLGLAAALARLLDDFQQTHGIVIDAYMPGLAEDRLPPAVETALYRILQEALTNTARHARAGHVSIVLERKPAFVRLIVEDDGVGFDPPTTSAAPAGGGFGLLSIQERVRLLRGAVTIESLPGSGTTLCVQVPLTEHDHGENPHLPRR
jgi:two-component system sensor histidine kinase UhpB